MWKQHTRPRSASASHTGSHDGWFQSSSVGGITGKYAAVNPRPAARSISTTAVAAFNTGMVAVHTYRGDARWYSIAQSLIAAQPAASRSGSWIDAVQIPIDG